MTSAFTISPAYNVRPGTLVEKDGVVFSCIFRGCTSCGLILYHLPDMEEVVVPFTDECRYGSLYSVRLKGLNPKEWAYRYYRDDYSFEDPYARELIQITAEDKAKLIACRFFPENEDKLPAYGNQKRVPFSDQVICVMHAKGFTASRTSKAAHPGTFRGIGEKIPYLKKLGVTALELLPVYERRPESLDMVKRKGAQESTSRPRYTMELAAESKETKPNYWNFAEGCYFAPKKDYASSESPQKEFSKLVNLLHKNGISVYLQLYFPEDVTIQTQLETARFYVTHYRIDGFHLKGSSKALRTIASDPMLSDTALFYYDFPYADLQKENEENPTVGRPGIGNLCEYRDDFEKLVRRFVKSDNEVLRDFVRVFTAVPAEHGSVHFVTNYEGFTLNDLVSYNWKHNEDNGEEGHDGCDENFSWNCGIEGKSQKKEVRALRQRQMKNFIALNFLAQGTPVVLAGDERCNSQNGNNNPYCQDNETGWVNWNDTQQSREILHFAQKMASFRREHSILRSRIPFRYNDYRVVGYPDLSFHGKDAWKPDYNGYSHTIGIMYDEDYAPENPTHSLLYLALNMHWHSQLLGIPQPPKGCVWFCVMDTFRDQSFYETPLRLSDQHHIEVHSRSVCILEAYPAKEGEETVQATVSVVKNTGKEDDHV